MKGKLTVSPELDEIFESQSNPIPEPFKIQHTPTKFLKYGKRDNHFEDYHPIVKIPNTDMKLRGRSELLVIKNDEVYLSKEKNGLCSSGGFVYCKELNEGKGMFIKNAETFQPDMEYEVPGGGWKPNEMSWRTAVREAKEEARLCCNSPRVYYAGDYVVTYDEPKEWIKENIPKKWQWRGYFTSVFIGSYVSTYAGHIDERDKDDLIDTGKFYPIEEVFPRLNPIHQYAIKKYYAYV